MKKTLKISAAILALSALTGLASAATPGTYVGGGLGYSNLGTPDHNIVTGPRAAGLHQSYDKTGWGERAFAGYNFNEYFGIEGGYAHYAKATYKTSAPGLASGSVEYSFQDINLVGKAYLPVYDTGVNVYALGGVAYVRSYGDEKLSSSIPGVAQHQSKTNNKFRPTYGVGVSYDIPQTQLTTNVEFSRVQGTGNVYSSNSAIPSANLVTLNLAYNFG
jgi:opacity protein-like surface antigen